MLLVILGAGASYDSSPQLPPPIPPNLYPRIEGPQEQSRPPLTADLFNPGREQFSYLERYGAATAIVRPLQRRLAEGGSLERLLGELQDEAEVYPQRHRQLVALRFFIRDFLHDCSARWWKEHSGVTTYAEFVGEINRYSVLAGEPVCYVTFNYDTLLDRTLVAQSLRDLSTIDGYIADDGPLYVKVHGSVDWLRRTDVVASEDGYIVPNSVLIDRAPELVSREDNEEYVIKNPPGKESALEYNVYQIGKSGPWYFGVPAISVPVEQKSDSSFEMPSSHKQTLLDSIAKAERILVVGWRGAEEHFNSLLKANLKGPDVPVTVVTGAGDENPTVVNLRALGLTEIRNANCGFTDLVEKGGLSRWLEP